MFQWGRSKNMIKVYVIDSLKRNFRYVGITNNLNRRLRAHTKGGVRSTAAHNPFKIIYTEDFKNYAEAREREIFLKSGQGRKFLDSIDNNGRVAKRQTQQL